MLQEIKNITGVTELSKSTQQNLKGGFGSGDYTCVGGETEIQPYQACPSEHPFLHPLGAFRCCATRWTTEGGLIESLE